MSIKSKLERQSDEEQKFLEEEILKISEKGKSIAINGLMIAGGLALSYMLFKVFIDNGKQKKKSPKTADSKLTDSDEEEENESFFGDVTKSLAKEALLLLLVVAKDKLIEYLNRDNNSDEKHSSGTSK